MNNYIKECFNTKGRFNRKKFWLYPLGLYLLILILTFLLGFFLNFLGANILNSIAILSNLFILINVYIVIISYIKRLRDLDKNPWMALLIIVPFANLYLLIICGFIKGTIGVNKYGPDPLGGIAENIIITENQITMDSVVNPQVNSKIGEEKIEL